MKANKIPAGQFKTHCLSLMDEVKKTGSELVITKHGKPVAKLVPIVGKPPKAFGYMKEHGDIKILGNIIEPIKVEWEVAE